MDEKEALALYRSFYILGDTTTLKILYELERYGEKNFSQLRDGLRINPATLSKKLKLLIQFNIIVADRSRDNLRVFYAMHEHQKSIRRILVDIEKLSQEL